MKKVFAIMTLLAIFVVIGNVPTQAQSLQITSNDNSQVVNENTSSCNVSSSGGTSNDTTNTNSNDTTGTISYQGGSGTSISNDPLVYPTISYTPRTASTDTSISYQDTVSYSLNTNTSRYPTLSVTSSTPLSYPTISYQVNEPSTNEITPIVNTNSCTVSIDPENTTVDEPIIMNLPSIYGNLSVNDSGIAYVEYGGNVMLKWESTGTSSCSIEPISQSGTQGQYLLQNIVSNTVITLSCEAAPGFTNSQIFPSWLGRVEVKVLPPSFGYLKNYLSQMQSSGSKKVNLTSTSTFIDQAQKAYDSGKTDNAKSFLQKSISDIAKQSSKGGYSSASISKYNEAVEYLIKTLPVKVVVASDGCSATATGPAGLIMQFGANENMRRGYGDEATIPASGTVTATIYAPNGWQSTAEVVDSTGIIYARDTKDVTTDNCPIPPVVYDPTLYNGYPEKWATPEPGTVIDDWGYYNKTAESYVAFRVTDSGRTFPTGYGNASDWLAKATADGYIVDYPQAGDIAINTLDVSFGGPIAWHVDSVDASGNYQTSAIRSDGNMNWSGGTVSGSTYLKYIRIP